MTDRKLRFGNAYRQIAVAARAELFDPGAGFRAVFHPLGAVHLGRQCLDLFLNGLIQIVEKIGPALFVRGLRYRVCKLLSTGTALCMMSGYDGVIGAGLPRGRNDPFVFLGTITVKGV